MECLEEAQGHALSAMLNITFAGKYKELGRLYEVGEMFQIEPAAFEDTGDANIDLILKLISEMDSVKESIRNLNGLEPMD